MRISTDRDDPGFVNWRKHGNVDVYLDGERQTDCFTADEEYGFVRVVRRDSEGKIVVLRSANEIAWENRYGKVQIFICE